MKRYYGRVQLEIKRDGTPHRFFWRCRLFTIVRIEERWRYTGKWWLDGRGWRRQYYRVTACAANTSRPTTMELYCEYGLWTLCGICD